MYIVPAIKWTVIRYSITFYLIEKKSRKAISMCLCTHATYKWYLNLSG